LVTATFVNNQFPLTVHISGDGSGQISSTPAGIGCSQPTCSANFETGTAVDLNAVGFSGSSFAGWSGACTGTSSCQLTMNSDNEVTATFNLNSQAASIEISGKLFTGSPLTYTATLNMNNVTQCTWDFGDGHTEPCDLPATTTGVGAVHDITVQTTHTYSETGTYLITVTAINDAGTVVASQEITIVAEGPTAEPPTDQPGPDKRLFFPYVNHP
jgi:PKD repeat protein